MHKCALLLKVQLLGLLPFNRLRYSSDKKEKRRFLLMAFSLVLVAAVLIFYSAVISIGAVKMGLSEILPPLMLTATSIVALVFTLLKSSSLMFGFQDYDMVMSLPISSSTVIWSRLLPVYGGDVAFGVGIMLPAWIVYGNAVQATPGMWVMMILTLLLAPLIPIVIGLILGAVISAISSRFRRKGFFTVAFTIIAIIALFCFSSLMPWSDPDQIIAIGQMLSDMFSRFYPPAGWFAHAMHTGSWSSFLLFAAVSIGAIVLFVLLLSTCYTRLNSALSSRRTRAAYQMGALKVGSPQKALYKKELRRLISTPMYLMNSCIGALFYIAMGVICLVVFSAQLTEAAAESPGEVDMVFTIFRRFAPWLAAFFIGISSSTSASISLEGKSRWHMCAAPVDSKAIFDSKIRVNLSILIPSCLIGSTLFAIALKATFVDALFLYLLPLGYAVLSSVIGLFFNLKFPKYDWTSEYQAVKQSMSVMATIGICMGSAMVFFVLTLVLLPFYIFIDSVVIIALFVSSWLIYRSLCQKRLYM